MSDDENTKARVFVSYSRKNTIEAQSLVDRLFEAGFDAYLDLHDIAPGEPWQERLGTLITKSEKVVFLVSTHSVASEIVAWEVDEAERQAKGILPVVIEETPTESIPGRLTRLNFIFMRDEKEREESFGDLVDALSTDLEWEREKTEINELALDWEAGGRNGRSLRFADSKIAGWERWRDRHPATTAPPTELQLAFIYESRRIATARQRKIVVLSFTAAAVAIILSIVAWTQRERAVENEKIAEVQRDNAQASQSRFLADLSTRELDAGRATRAMLIALEGLPHPDRLPDRTLIRETDFALSSAMAKVRLDQIYAGSAVIAHDWSTAVIGLRTGSDASLIDPNTGRHIADLGKLDQAGFAPSGKYFWTRTSFDTGAALRDSKTGAELISPEAAERGYVGFSTTGRYFVTGRKVWDVKTASLVYEREHRTDASFSPNDEVILTRWREPGVHGMELRRANDNLLIRAESTTTFLDWFYVTDKTQSQLAIRTGEFTLEVIDIPTGETIASLDATTRGWDHIDFKYFGFVDGEPQLRIGGASMTFGLGTDILWDYQSDEIAVAPPRRPSDCARGEEKTTDTAQLGCMEAFSQNGTRRVTIGEEVVLWDAQLNEPIKTLEGHDANVERAVFSPDSKYVLTLTRAETHVPYDDFARLWDAETGRLAATLDHKGEQFEAGFSPDGRLVYTGDEETTHFWRVKPGGGFPSLERRSPEERFAVDDLGVSVAKIGNDGGSLRKDLETGMEIACNPPTDQSVADFALSQDGGILVVLSDDGKVVTLDALCNTTGTTGSLGSGPISIEFSGDGQRLLVELDTAVAVLRMPTLEELIVVERMELVGERDYADRIRARLDWSGSRLAIPFRLSAPEVGTDKIELKLFDVTSRAQISPGFEAAAAVFSGDGSKIVLLGKDSVVLNAANGEVIAKPPVRFSETDKVSFDPTGDHFVVLSDRGEQEVLIIDAETGEIVGEDEERWFYPFGYGPLDFSADGSRFVLLTSGQATSQNRFDIYETATGKLLNQQVIGDGNTSPSSAVFGYNDKTIITAVGGEIIFYDAETYEIVSRMETPYDYVSKAWVSADGKNIIAEYGSELGGIEAITAIPLYTSTTERIAAAKKLAARCLTPEERREIFLDEQPPAWCLRGARFEVETEASNWEPLYPY
jgi:WD40 repeat protein